MGWGLGQVWAAARIGNPITNSTCIMKFILLATIELPFLISDQPPKRERYIDFRDSWASLAHGPFPQEKKLPLGK
jgi:hypothetical protein